MISGLIFFFCTPILAGRVAARSGGKHSGSGGSRRRRTFGRDGRLSFCETRTDKCGGKAGRAPGGGTGVPTGWAALVAGDGGGGLLKSFDKGTQRMRGLPPLKSRFIMRFNRRIWFDFLERGMLISENDLFLIYGLIRRRNCCRIYYVVTSISWTGCHREWPRWDLVKGFSGVQKTAAKGWPICDPPRGRISRPRRLTLCLALGNPRWNKSSRWDFSRYTGPVF